MRTPAREDSTLELFAALPAEEQEEALQEVARKHGVPVSALKARLLKDWRIVGRPKQQAPPGTWTYWMILAGRGFGKTVSGAQWSKDKLLERRIRFALVAPTFADVRDTMVEGETGLLNVIPAEALLGQSRDDAWNRSIGELTLANESKARAFSSERPDSLRGPQHHDAWCEEVSSFKDAHRGDELGSTWSNVKLGCRLGEHPQIAVTTTPKPNRLTKDLLALPAPRMIAVRGSSYENRANLAEAWWQEVVAPLEGTRTGRQEIMAELLEDVEGALWSRAQLDLLRVPPDQVPILDRILVAVDPNASDDAASNSAGIIVVGRGRVDRRGYVLEDRTVTHGGPRAWARASVDAYHDWKADRIVAEKNNGGEMVKITLQTVDPNVPVKLVWASRGKRTRAEPVSSLYEGDPELGNPPKVSHAGVFPELEDEMCFWTPESDSPDRMDALVWGLTELLLTGASGVYRSSVARGQLPPPVGR